MYYIIYIIPKKLVLMLSSHDRNKTLTYIVQFCLMWLSEVDRYFRKKRLFLYPNYLSFHYWHLVDWDQRKFR